MKDLYEKMELLSGADENGRYWEIRPRTFIEVLRETDLVELADWIARELGWIRRDRDVDVGHLGELERGSSTISVGLGELECAGRVAGGDGELELEGDPGELEREGDPGELGLEGDPGELERAAGVAGGDGELERGEDPGELGRGGDPGELGRGEDPGELERTVAPKKARARRRRRRGKRERGVSLETIIMATALKGIIRKLISMGILK